MAALKRPEPQSGPGFRLSVAQAFQNAHAMPQINGLERFQLSDLDSLDVAIDGQFSSCHYQTCSDPGRCC
jgi:hypothetical protein